MAGALSSKPLISASRLIHRKTKRTGIGDLLGSGAAARSLDQSRIPSPSEAHGAVRRAGILACRSRPALAETALQLRDSAGVAPDFPRLVTRIRLSGQYRAAPTLCRRANRVPFAVGHRNRVFAWA